MDKEYIIRTLKERIAVLKKRYALACAGKDENGNERGTYLMGNTRHESKKDLRLCMLIYELITQVKGTLDLSEDAVEGLDRLMSPIERHRRLGGYKHAV